MSRLVIETLIARQLHHYNHLRALLRERPQAPPPPPRPVVTISRVEGCDATALAATLAARLGVQVWDRELVDRIALDTGLRRDFIAQLDEGLINGVEAWVRGLIGGRLFLRDDYALALARTVKTLAETGGAVFVGRGAGFILGDRADLRLRLVTGARRRGDQARAAFVMDYFKADVHDPAHYDLVLNADRVPVGVMVEVCECLVRARRLRKLAAAES